MFHTETPRTPMVTPVPRDGAALSRDFFVALAPRLIGAYRKEKGSHLFFLFHSFSKVSIK